MDSLSRETAVRYIKELESVKDQLDLLKSRHWNVSTSSLYKELGKEKEFLEKRIYDTVLEGIVRSEVAKLLEEV